MTALNMEFQQPSMEAPFEIISPDNTLSYFEEVVRKPKRWPSVDWRPKKRHLEASFCKPYFCFSNLLFLRRKTVMKNTLINWNFIWSVIIACMFLMKKKLIILTMTLPLPHIWKICEMKWNLKFLKRIQFTELMFFETTKIT